MKDLQTQLNILYDTIQKVKLVELVLLDNDLDDEVKEIIKIKHSLNEKVIEINNKLYEENKKEPTC